MADNDNVLIAKEELSRKELFLKDRLYSMRNVTMSKQSQKLCEGNKKDPRQIDQSFGTEHIPVYNDRPVMKFPVKDPVNTSAVL
jgi:hypothetical protein